MKTVFHLDMDAFFVSVEELFDPSLKGKPVVVGGQPNERGVVSAASYEARKFGVHSALPLRTAYKLCPGAIFLDGHPRRYREYSEKVYKVLTSFSPVVEMASIDEAYLDMAGTERLYGPPLRAAHLLHEEMARQVGLNCSIGIGTSRLIAKVCSNHAKPNGILMVLPGQEVRFLAPLEIRKIPGVGKVTEKNLHSLGIRKVGDLAKMDELSLREKFGEWGLALAGKAKGLDAGGWYAAAIGEERGPKSISHEHTFDVDTDDAALLGATLARLTEKVGRRLREHELHARRVELKLRYADFRTLTRSRTLAEPTQLDTRLLEEARRLFQQNWTGSRIRLLGVQASLLESGPRQLGLLEAESSDRWGRALKAADRMRDKFGNSAVSLAAGLGGDSRERVHENPAGLVGRRAKRLEREEES